MPTGTVKWFSTEKRFGFIQPDEGRDDHFVHESGVLAQTGTLKENDKVEFDVEAGKKGLKAINVRRI